MSLRCLRDLLTSRPLNCRQRTLLGLSLQLCTAALVYFLFWAQLFNADGGDAPPLPRVASPFVLELSAPQLSGGGAVAASPKRPDKRRKALKPRPPPRQPDVAASHFTTHPRANYTCADAGDSRLNCTRCIPGWLGPKCADRVHAVPCTLQRCLVWTRCPRGKRLTVHVTTPPVDDATAAWMDSKTTAEYRDILHALRASPRHVSSADDACIRIPWVDTLCNGNRCTDTWTDAPKVEALAAALAAQPGWDGGANFLLFDMSSAYQPSLPIGRGIYAASSFWAAGASFRHGHDIALPLWDQRWRNAEGRDTRVPAEKRPLLLSFKGQRMFWCNSSMCSPPDLADAVRAGSLRPAVSYQHGWVRNLARSLHNGRDVTILTRCSRELEAVNLCNKDCAERCAEDGREYGRHDYFSLLSNSSFGLVLPGITPMSYRLAETMAAGAVPVIVSDFMVLPFTSHLNWTSLALRVPEALLLRVPDMLRALDASTVSNMRAAVAVAYSRCFATPGAIALCALEELERRALAGSFDSVPAQAMS